MMRNGDMVEEVRKSLHIGAFGKERECLTEKDLDRIAYFDSAEFVCVWSGGCKASERKRQRRIFGHSSF